MRILIALMVVVSLVIPAAAGDSDCGGKKGCSPCGYECETKCPLAQQANDCRAFGAEADGTSEALRDDDGSAVEDNLSGI